MYKGTNTGKGNLYANTFAQIDFLEITLNLFKVIGRILYELYYGVRTGTLPWMVCLCIGAAASLIVRLQVDYKLFVAMGWDWLYPDSLIGSKLYWGIAFCSGFPLWAVYRACIRQRFSGKLKRIFEACGLKNQIGEVPKYVSDYPVGDGARRLRVSRALLPVEAFQKAKTSIEASLGIYIDEIREKRDQMLVDIIYSTEPMGRLFKLDRSWCTSLREGQFIVGGTRQGVTSDSLTRTPHLLIAGETGGGKSTFLKQFITSLYVNDTSCRFTLIDLKGGLEFKVFEDLPRVSVLTDVEGAAASLKDFPNILRKRMALLRETGFTDMGHAIDRQNRPDFYRHIIVVDEAAEMFLKGSRSGSEDLHIAREVLSQIARQGRAAGVHLVVATQRPDTRALDSQIKANLTGILCFKMLNDASSINVLGNGKATDLPAIPGRALWKCYPHLLEVQTPYLPEAEMKAMLEAFREETENIQEASLPSLPASTPNASSNDRRYETLD